MDERPIDGITYAEAQVILNRSISWIAERVLDGTLSRGPRYKKATLSRAEVEQLAVRLWRPRRHVPNGYWCTRNEAATILGISPAWVSQLAKTGRLPVLRPQVRNLLLRRAQIEVIARTWTARAQAKRTPGRPNRAFVVRAIDSDSAIGIEALRPSAAGRTAAGLNH